jgi:hypothetical protein
VARLPQYTKGRPWTLKVVPRLRIGGQECWGVCDAAKREISITRATEKHGVARVTFLHEYLHKLMWLLDEEVIEQMAHEIDEGLDVMESLLL